MPMYDYRCEPCSREFEDLRPMAERHTTTCGECGAEAHMVIRTLPRIDPNADLPWMRQQWRKNAERRGRGADMTAANKTVEAESIHREAWERRQAYGETKIISTK